MVPPLFGQDCVDYTVLLWRRLEGLSSAGWNSTPGTLRHCNGRCEQSLVRCFPRGVQKFGLFCKMTSGVRLGSTVDTHSRVSIRSIRQSRVLASGHYFLEPRFGHMSVFASLEEYRKFWMYWAYLAISIFRAPEEYRNSDSSGR